MRKKRELGMLAWLTLNFPKEWLDQIEAEVGPLENLKLLFAFRRSRGRMGSIRFAVYRGKSSFLIIQRWVGDPGPDNLEARAFVVESLNQAVETLRRVLAFPIPVRVFGVEYCAPEFERCLDEKTRRWLQRPWIRARRG